MRDIPVGVVVWKECLACVVECIDIGECPVRIIDVGIAGETS